MAVKRGKARNHYSNRDSDKPASHTSHINKKSDGAGSAQHKLSKADHHIPQKLKHGRIEEETYMPAPEHMGKYKIPLGIRCLIGYMLFVSIIYVISFITSIAFPTTILFGQMVEGPRALVVNIVMLALNLVVLYGLWARKPFAFDFSIGVFLFNTLNSLLSITLFEWTDHPFKKLMLLSFASLILVNVVVIWYILHEKKYFYAKVFRDGPIQHIDKIFLYTVVTFWVVAALIGVTLGAQYYKETITKIDGVMDEMQGDFNGRGEYVCSLKTGEDKDICALVLVTAQKELQVSSARLYTQCQSMHSDFYRFVCLRSVA